jgi:trehalose 6-phosphate phosphatase
VGADGLLARLRAEPQQAALFFDVDGVLAPIVEQPEDATVPEETRVELRRLAASYGLVACVSGRAGDDALRVVGVDELVYVGEHGLELDANAPYWHGPLREFAETVDWPVEEKGLTLSFHYRTAPDEEAAEQFLLEVAERARDTGLVPRFGRKVLEIRPPLETNKGTAVRFLLDGRGLRRALYAGDDSTDLDAFRVLGEGDLDVAVRVGIASEEGPRGIVDDADIVLRSPAELAGLLRAL